MPPHRLIDASHQHDNRVPNNIPRRSYLFCSNSHQLLLHLRARKSLSICLSLLRKSRNTYPRPCLNSASSIHPVQGVQERAATGPRGP